MRQEPRSFLRLRFLADAYAFALFAMHYNFARICKTLRQTPAMAAGVTERLWSMEDIIRIIDANLESEKASKSNRDATREC